MNILVLNAGSSSLKFTILEKENFKEICEGVVERIGINNGKIKYTFTGEKKSLIKDIANHKEALD
jgi:acetate kinase